MYSLWTLESSCCKRQTLTLFSFKWLFYYKSSISSAKLISSTSSTTSSPPNCQAFVQPFENTEKERTRARQTVETTQPNSTIVAARRALVPSFSVFSKGWTKAWQLGRLPVVLDVEEISFAEEILLKFRYFEKATKNLPIFNSFFWHYFCQIINGRLAKYLWTSQNIWTLVVALVSSTRPSEYYCVDSENVDGQNWCLNLFSGRFELNFFLLLPKGQLISKCPFGVIVSTKLSTNEIFLRISALP